MDRAELEERRRNREKRKKREQQLDTLVRFGGMGVIALLAVVLVLVIRAIFAGSGRQGEAVVTQAVQQVSGSDQRSSETYAQTNGNGVVTRSGSSISALPTPVTPDPNSVIYFTFDDGPSSEVTPKLLDLLEENEVPATFFIINYEDELKYLVQREVADGHTVAMHAWNHDYAKCYTEEDAYLNGVKQLAEKVYQDTGYSPFCLRFPGGSSNTVSRKYNSGIMTRLTQQVDADPNWTYYDWNVDSTDASGNNRDPDLLANNAIRELQKGQHNIILCHDTNNKTTTVTAVAKIIEYGRANGFCFAAISRDTPPVHHGTNN